MKLAFDEKINGYQLVEDAPHNKAEMEKSMSSTFDKITGFEIADIPLGAAVVGGTAAILIDRVLLERIDPTHKYAPFAMLGASFLLAKFGKKYVGKAAEVTALILAYEAIADYISMGIDKIWPTATTATAGNSVVRQAQAVVNQASATTGDYYGAAFRR